MYLEDERVEKCQTEIRRLRSVCRENEDDIKRLNVLLCNAIEYINELTGQTDLGWYEETLGITKEEASRLNVDCFEE